MKILVILHDFRIFFIGKGSFYHFLRKTRKILVFKTYFFIHMPTVVQKNWLRFPPIIHQILMTIRHSYYIHVCTVDSRYLEFDGTMENIRVNRSSTQEELLKYRKCSLFYDERETTRAKFWRAKTSIACFDSRNDFKLIRCFCCCFFFC